MVICVCRGCAALALFQAEAVAAYGDDVLVRGIDFGEGVAQAGALLKNL